MRGRIKQLIFGIGRGNRPDSASVGWKAFGRWKPRCVFRIIVTDRFGNVTAEFGNVTGHFGDVTEAVLLAA